jgi:hypothetical protein
VYVPAEDLDEERGDAVAEARLHEPLSEEEREDDEPDDVVGHRAERLLERERLGDHSHGEAAEGPREGLALFTTSCCSQDAD